jgi:hypothetical protein
MDDLAMDMGIPAWLIIGGKMSNTDEPLIYTTKGNLPIKDLNYSHSWEDADTYMKFIETYTLDGEVVKQSAHVFMKQGQQLNSELEKI